MNPQEIQPYLQRFINHEVSLHRAKADDFRLDGLRLLLRFLGNPHQHLRCVHIAGTKGKGSTSVFIAEALRQAGYRVGLFTSPHLYDVSERIRILEPGGNSRGEERLFSDVISESQLADCLGSIQSILEQNPNIDLTYFEVLTAAAFEHFIQSSVDIVILECGLGGRFDATNVVDSLICAITPIGWDHQEILGRTLSAIAREKAGIIKHSCGYVVLSRQPAEAYSVLEEVCWANNSRVLSVGEEIEVEDIQQTIEGINFSICYEGEKKRFQLSLLGEIQAENAAVAYGLSVSLKHFGFLIEEQHLFEGFQKAFWPCRFERVAKEPYVIVDSAHTVDSLKKVLRTFFDLFPNQKCIVVFGASQDKDIQGMCAQLDRDQRRVFLVQARHPRAHPWAQDKQSFFSKADVSVFADLNEALGQAVEEARSSVGAILVVGSIYLAAEARAIICQKF